MRRTYRGKCIGVDAETIGILLSLASCCQAKFEWVYQYVTRELQLDEPLFIFFLSLKALYAVL